MRISTNIAALTAYNALNHTGSQIQKTIQKLLTGLRINSASDDAAGLAISEKMRAQTAGLDVAQRNAQDGISMLQTAEGALASTNSILLRMRELSVQAANDTLTANDRSFIQLEIDELKDEINRIANTTQFNGKRLLDGSSGALWAAGSLSTKALIRGGLVDLDQFNQKIVTEGNYDIEIRANPGTAQVQKSSIFKIKHPNVTMGETLNEKAGAVKVRVNNVPAGDYELKSEEPTEARAVATGTYGMRLDELEKNLKVHVSQSNLLNNASILFEVTHTDKVEGTVTVKATANVLKTDGTTENYFDDSITLTEGAYTDLSMLLGLGNARTGEDSLDGAMEMKLASGKVGEFSVGDKFVYNLTVARDVEGADRTVKIVNTQNAENPDAWQEVVEIQSSNVFEKTTQLIPAKVVFVIDDSGSMRGSIMEVSEHIQNFIRGILDQEVSGLQVGIATYSKAYQLDPSTGQAITTNPKEQRLLKYMIGGNVWSASLTKNNLSTEIGSIRDALNSAASNVSKVGGVTVDHYYAIGKAIENYDLKNSGVANYIILVTDTDREVIDGANGITQNDVRQSMQDSNTTLVTIRPDFAGDVFADLVSKVKDKDGNEFNLELNQRSQAWGTELSNLIGPIIGQDAVKKVLYETTPLGNFIQFTEDGLDGRKLFENSSDPTTYTLQVEQNGVSHSITIGAQDTLKDISDKLTAAVGSGTTVEITPVISENEEGINVISLQTMMSGGQGRVTYSGDPKLIATLGLRSNLDQKYSLDASAIMDREIHFRNFYLNSVNGTVREGNIVLTTNSNEMGLYETLTSFEAAYVGQIARETTRLRDLQPFWNTSGVFMLDDPRTITITQGDGRSASVTLYANDTVEDARAKLNNAIANDLGQARHVKGDVNRFVTYVEEGRTQANGLETVEGTFVIRSAIPGHAGELSFSGDQALLNALALNTIQESSESRYTASVYNAHTGVAVATNVQVTGNQLLGVIHENVDLEFDAMSGITATWNEAMKRYELRGGESRLTIHLVDSSTVFQVGANKGEDLALDIGDMTAGSLGITKVNVATREAASRAIGQLDAAINKVSAQRAKIGAYQNSLEYTIENLQTTATNLTAAESRIRDADMAKTMMEFVKLQILNQSGTSMLAQANQLPQQVLSLLQ